jgi:hypothetical protein
MFIGHYSAAFIAAAHPKAPRLGTLFIAAQLVDIAFFSFVLLGIEHMRITPGATVMNPMDLYDMPLTHSLIGSLAWAAAFGIVVLLLTRKAATALIAALVVPTHWLLDLLVHRPDLTLAGGSAKLGLGLWNHPMIEMPLEILLTLGSAWIYVRATKARSGPRWSIWLLLGALFAMQAFNWFGTQPTELEPGFSILGLVGYGVAAALATWVGRRRVPLAA